MTTDEELEDLRRLAELEGKGPTQLEKLGTKIKEGAKGVGQSLLAGFGKAAAAYPLAMSKAPQLPLQLLSAVAGFPKMAQETGQFYGEMGKNSPLPEPAKPFVEGAGGAFAAAPNPTMMAHPIVTAAAGGVGNTAADLTKKFTKDLGEVPSEIAAAIAGMLAGGATAFAGGPKQRVAESDIREALAPVPGRTGPDPKVQAVLDAMRIRGKAPKHGTFQSGAVPGADFDSAQSNVDLMLRNGSPTGTLAEAFPPNSQIMSLARKARGAETGGRNPLVLKTEGRADELTQIGNDIPDLMAPGKVETGQAAQAGAAAAEKRLTEMEKAMKADYGAIIAEGKPIRPDLTANFQKYMRAEAEKQDLPAEKAAYLEVAASMDGTKGVLTNLRQMVNAAKMAKANALTGKEGAAKAALSVIYDRPYKLLESFLEDQSPAFAKAQKLYPSADNFIDSMKSSPLGQMAGSNYDPSKVVPTSRLGVLESFDDPENLKRFLSELEAGDPNNPRLLQDLAKALVQKKVRPGPGDAAQKVAGTEGSKQAQMFDELLTQTGTNNPQVQDKLRLARRLQDFQGPGGINSNIPDMRTGQALIRPFRTIDMFLTGQLEKGTQKEIATLLADPKNLKRLQEIAMFDPSIRKLLTVQGALTPGLVQSTQ